MELIESWDEFEFQVYMSLSKRQKLLKARGGPKSDAYDDDFILGIGGESGRDVECQVGTLCLLDIISQIWYRLFGNLCVKMHVFDSYQMARDDIRTCFILKYLVCHDFGKLEYPVYLLNSIETAMKMLKYMVHVNLYGFGMISRVNLYRLYCQYMTDKIRGRSSATESSMTVIITKRRLESSTMEKKVEEKTDEGEKKKDEEKKKADEIIRESSRIIRVFFEKMVIKSAQEGPGQNRDESRI